MNKKAERKRLVELLKDAERKYLCNGTNIPQMAEFIADHLLDNGFIVPPVKVGDKVYFTYNNNVYDLTIEKIVQKESGLFLVDKQCNDWYPVEEIGKILFTSREEAQKALGGEQ